MNDRQRSKYNSHLAVRTLCEQDANRTLSSSLPAWAAIHDRLLAKISHADACVLTQASHIAGITTAKKSARTSLIASIIATGGALRTLALLREDPVLVPKADTRWRGARYGRRGQGFPKHVRLVRQDTQRGMALE